jgi:hypothetical protein
VQRAVTNAETAAGQTCMKPTSVLVTFCNQRSSPTCSVLLLELPALRARWLPVDPGPAQGQVTGATGVARAEAGFFVALQSGRFGILNKYSGDGELQAVLTVEDARDIHSLWYEPHERRLLVTSTGTDSIVACELDDRETKIVGQEVLWRLGGAEDERDAHHINSVVRHEDRYLASIFGPKPEEGWAGVSTGAVVDVAGDEPVQTGLHQPHTLRVQEDDLWVLASGSGRLHALGSTRRPRSDVAELGGYLRGLALTPDALLVGVSAKRTVSRSEGTVVRSLAPEEDPNSSILVVEPDTFEVLGRFPLGLYGREIYDIEVVPRELPVPEDRDGAAATRIRFMEERYLDTASRSTARQRAAQQLQGKVEALQGAEQHLQGKVEALQRDLDVLRQDKQVLQDEVQFLATQLQAISEERQTRLEELNQGVATAWDELARLADLRAEDLDQVVRLQQSYDTLRNRRSVRFALRVARLAWPAYRAMERYRR